MSLALTALIVFGIALLTIDAIYTTIAWLIGQPHHPYQRPHHWRRYAGIVSLIAGEVAAISVLAVLLVRVVQAPGMSL